MSYFGWQAWMAGWLLFWFGWGRVAMLQDTTMKHAWQVTGTMFLMALLFGAFALPERLADQTTAQFEAAQMKHWANWVVRGLAAAIGTLTAWRRHGERPLKPKSHFPGL